MRNSNELLIGLFTSILLVVLYWGVNFLKGENVFSDKRFFYAVYDNVNGLTISRPVTVNGFKVGQVSNIMLNPSQLGHLTVEIAIEEDVSFSNQAILEIYDYDIMGKKAVQLKIVDSGRVAISGDTLVGTIATGLTSEVSEQFGSMKIGLDQVMITFNKVLKEVNNLSVTANRILASNEKRLSSSIQNIESIATEIDKQTQNINSLINNMTKFSNDLNSIDLVQFSNNMINISNELESLLSHINSGQGSLGKFINQDAMYQELSTTIQSMNSLISDIEQNPQKYVNISLWGNDKKKSK